MDAREIAGKVIALKRTGSRLLTNCYAEAAIEKAEAAWESDGAVLFSYDDHGVKRLVYYASGQGELARVLRRVKGEGHLLEFLTRDVDENREALESAGFQVLARMMRMSNPRCNDVFIKSPVLAYRDDAIGSEADVSDARKINQKLWAVFDTRVSHLLSDDELAEAIQRGEVSIHRGEDGEVDAFLQTVVQPRKFYINQVYNGAEKRVIHAMLLRRLKEYVDGGGQYLYSWVETGNVASVKFHQKYGMRHDGMWDMVYVKRDGEMGTGTGG